MCFGVQAGDIPFFLTGFCMIVSSFSVNNHDASVRQFAAKTIIAFLVIFQYANIVLVQGVFHAFYIFKFGSNVVLNDL